MADKKISGKSFHPGPDVSIRLNLSGYNQAGMQPRVA